MSQYIGRMGKYRILTDRFIPATPLLDTSILTNLYKFIIRHHGGIFVLTGAGVSTESGIPDYRSEGVGLYARSTRRPMSYSDFLKNEANRKRYWARSYVGWSIYREYEPNLTHKILSRMERREKMFHWLVTQNVDALHLKAESLKVTELHGSLHRVVCLTCGCITSREEVQSMIRDLNLEWRGTAGDMAPDGDTTVPQDVVSSFKMLDCPSCGGILKPDIVFFGDNVQRPKVEFISQKLSQSTALLVLGSSLQVYSAYRLILQAKSLQIPIAVVNIGPTRADGIIDMKISGKCSDVFKWLAEKWNIDYLSI
ncbi:NAD-dependent protein lipoamidase sirtuin-4, mitochondrial-like isoform X1 [Oopsacas minuta]|uniref:NAD-dependent protein lipoamidase sirtuin-4, mitochondrial-like isoform X1 n=1 Tax=Oopsacas minuta TaxID=111878 RepID=A0AAV7JKF2_9METZ|nr:NAD-dependent protein lipoamidase sirtuin-4, mitochondrial-like isoform X1 [Oopsacas minuta]